MTMVFYNNGHLDLESAMVFGVNAKESSNPIGYFGTGLKYSVATILRNGGSVRVYTGGSVYEVTSENIEFRNKDFSKVVLIKDGKDTIPLGFTTELGKNWEPWMIYRELHSNALDESGSSTRTDNVDEYVSSWDTCIVVDWKELDSVYDRHDEIFVSSPVLVRNYNLEIRAGETNYVYYKGVRVAKLRKPMLYTYNILHGLTLTEDRTLKEQGMLEYHLPHWIAPMEGPENVLVGIITATEDTFESTLVFSSAYNFSEQVKELTRKAANSPRLNRHLRKAATELGWFVEFEEVEMSSLQKAQLKKASDFLQRAGGVNLSEYDVVVAKLHGPLGLAANNKIYLDPSLFSLGTKFVAHGLYEEYIHLVTGYGDETRELQSHLFKQILTMMEEKLGEPV